MATSKKSERVVERELLGLLKKSVKKNKADAIFLSGGIDSGLLSALAKPKIAITCRFPYGKKYDEFDDAKKTAKHLGIRHIVITPTKEDFLDNLENAVKAYKPTSHFSLVPLYLLFKKASEIGIKTILSGEGPDELLGGYARYIPFLEEKKLYDNEALENYTRMIDNFRGNVLERYCNLVGYDFEKAKRVKLKSNGLIGNLGEIDLAMGEIEIMEQALAKHFGIRLLYPFLEKEVVDYCQKLPDNMRINGFTKIILRRIAEKFIPYDIAWRINKMGGPVAPVGKWLGEKDEFSKKKYLDLQWKLYQSS